MKIWYIASNNDSNSDPILTAEWSRGYLEVIFTNQTSQFLTKVSSKIQIIKLRERSKNYNLPLGEPFLTSYLFSEEVIEYIQTTGCKPDLLIVNNQDNTSYYLLVEKWAINQNLQDIPILLISAKTSLLEQETSDVNLYKFPFYWKRQTEKFSLAAADYVIALDPKIYTTIRPYCIRNSAFFEINEIKQKNCLETVLVMIDKARKSRDQNKYPVSDSIPAKGKTRHVESVPHLLSIVIPFYNLGEYLLESLQSIFCNFYRHYEVIIVDDGTDDPKSLDVLTEVRKRYPDIKIIRIKNSGLANARNVGAMEARGEFLTFLDADDLIEPEYYRKAIELLNSYENISFVYSWVRFIGKREDIWITFNCEFPYLLASNMLAAFAVMRREDFINFGVNKLEMEKGMEDYESWVSMCESGCPGISIPYPLVKYRIRTNSMSRKFDRDTVINLYQKLSAYHPSLYSKFGKELFNICTANGPGYMWNNPTISYLPIIYGNSDSVNNLEEQNQMKYELMRIMHSKRGALLIKLFFKLRLNKFF
jgi:glycosyltransferase involved in cell wall biosynthesis